MIPRRSGLNSCRAFPLHDKEVRQTEGDVEGALVEIRGRVDLVDNVCASGFCRVEGFNVRAVGRNPNESDFTGSRATGRTSDALHKIHTSTVSSSW